MVDNVRRRILGIACLIALLSLWPSANATATTILKCSMAVDHAEQVSSDGTIVTTARDAADDPGDAVAITFTISPNGTVVDDTGLKWGVVKNGDVINFMGVLGIAGSDIISVLTAKNYGPGWVVVEERLMSFTLPNGTIMEMTEQFTGHCSIG